MECHRILVVPCSCTPEIPTACISFQLSPMSFAARATADCESIELATGGASWEPLVRGLPQKRAYETVLRDAMLLVAAVRIPGDVQILSTTIVGG